MEIAQNSFNGGLLMDMNDTVVPNTVLTDCLNGTIITFDGNEFILQNDSGNGRVESCALKKDFIPLGIKQYGGIIYIASMNPLTGECELGSFPSPERNISSEELSMDDIDTDILDSTLYPEGKSKGLQITYLKADFSLLQRMVLRPGDKFLIYITPSGNSSSINDFIETYKNYNTTFSNGKLQRRVFSLHLATVNENGSITYIEDQTNVFTNEVRKFFYTEEEAFGGNIQLKTVQDPSLYNTYSSRFNGYLIIVLEIEPIDFFNIEIGDVTENGKDDYDVELIINSESDSYNNVYGVRIEKDEKGTYEDEEIDPEFILKPGENIPQPVISIKHDLLKLSKGKDTRITIKPYSRFQWFENLKYTTVLNYRDLLTSKESNIWRYSTTSTTNIEGREVKRVTITTDFFVRGTSNGLNKCDVMYIEFYDVSANASLIYPLSKVISGSYNFSIDCFDKDLKVEPYYYQNGEEVEDINSAITNFENNYLESSGTNYYLLLDSSRLEDYFKIVSGETTQENIDTKVSSISNPRLPWIYKIEPQLGNDTRIYKNFSTQTDYVYNSEYTRLRYNNFYICRICGLSFNKDTEKHQFEVEEYNALYTLFTNGQFNSYYTSAITEDTKNFSTLKVEDYITVISDSTINLSEKNVTGPTIVHKKINESVSETLPLTSASDLILEGKHDGIQYETTINNTSTISSEYKLRKINKLNFGILNADITYSSDTSNYNLTTPGTPLIFPSAVVSDNKVQNDENVRELTITATLNKQVKSETYTTNIPGDKIEYNKWEPVGLLGWDGLQISSGIPYYHNDDGAGDWICVKDGVDNIFVDENVSSKWVTKDPNKGGYDRDYTVDVGNSPTTVVNKIKSRLGNNKIGILAFAGDSLDTSLEAFVNDWGSRTCNKLYFYPKKNSSKYYPSTFVIIEFDGDTMCICNIYGTRVGNNMSVGTIKSEFNTLFNNLYRASKVSGASNNPYTIPNPDTIKYDNLYDTTLEGKIKLTGSFSSVNINIKTDDSTISLNDRITTIINTYIDSLEDNKYYIGYGSTDTVPDKTKLEDYKPIETTQAPFSASIPYRYIFSSSLTSSNLNKVKNIYLEASSYTTYISKDLDNMYATNNEKLYFKRVDKFEVHPLFSILNNNIHLIGMGFGASNQESRYIDWYAFRNLSDNEDCCNANLRNPDDLVFSKQLQIRGNITGSNFSKPENLVNFT